MAPLGRYHSLLLCFLKKEKNLGSRSITPRFILLKGDSDDDSFNSNVFIRPQTACMGSASIRLETCSLLEQIGSPA
jgi:hypothetical protein